MMHPEAVKALEPFAALEPVTADGFDVQARRDVALGWARNETRPDIEYVVDVDAHGVPCRLFRPFEHSPLIVYAHGGGFVFGEIETHDAHARRLAETSGSAVLLVDYRRAPEARYPAASDDLDKVVRWAHEDAAKFGVDGGSLSTVGDSAGGQLSLLAALRNPGAFSSVALVYPVVDPRGTRASYRRESGGLNAEEMDWYWQQYLGPNPDLNDPELDPTSLDLSGLPPTLVITAEHDPLVDEGEALAVAIAADGVPSVATRYLGMPHAFWRMPVLDAAHQATCQIASFLRQPPSRG